MIINNYELQPDIGEVSSPLDRLQIISDAFLMPIIAAKATL